MSRPCVTGLEQLDRMAADGRISADDAAAVHDFAAFLRDPTSRCPICMAADHTRPSQCPEISDRDRRRIGVIAMDVHAARKVARIRPGQR